MSETGIRPPEVFQLFSAADSGVLGLLRREVGRSIPLWGSLLILPRTGQRRHDVRLMGELPDNKRWIASCVHRTRLLALNVRLMSQHADSEESLQRSASGVGGLLVPRYIVVFHHHGTPDEICHVVTSWIALASGILTREDIDGLARRCNNPALMYALSVLPEESVA